ncbi:hypothetical protein AB840_07590 [Megasphaera cerevisiae DSM 20462]|jgi:uncharacterized membrane-anchored protein YjiN (DUF445 family)|uniref:DUF445 domain-containing protein n=1 Tax=Megasphaera cerevisiae DSM 20462 TaxID=1122219 RepID=A0A0J6WST9_9FIRM|nr:DUF445 family protein [Megasphaera cerevisiae]KMO86570.1 hypothetical protein AB840_07590 [Megasphaera cerevisiae DSM 20462]OKY53740.1 hypothetical protein BSR42_05735 [Megasphaera cerevisiae]SJZ90513.1 Uncharacterized membrane-anchored protein YjiN, DUF445 family [Megasphaera cerevisiae DSM 20462]
MTYRQRANGILALSFFCFCLIFWWWDTHEVSLAEELLFFVIQSALIGSIADWFAVTALFERPLGFPYHTELLYSHRHQIIDGMTKIVSEKLLQPNMWQDKLYQISFMDKVTTWLKSPGGNEKFRTLLYEVAQRFYRYAQQGGTQDMIAAHIRDYLKRQPLVGFFQDRLISLLEDPNSHMFNDAVGLGKELVNSDDFDVMLEQIIRDWMEESKNGPGLLVTLNKFTGLVDTHKIAKDIKIGILAWLDQWEHAEGEQREWLCRKLELFLYSMNGQLAYAVQNWQDQFVDSLPIERWLSATQHAGQDYFMSGEGGKEKLKDLLEEQFLHYLEYCRTYPEIKDWLDEQIRRACTVILEHEHSLIAVAVRDVLSGFDKRKFNEFLERKVGEDLAWIRINGAIVGGTLGLIVFSFLKFLYEPAVVPFIRQLFL